MFVIIPVVTELESNPVAAAMRVVDLGGLWLSEAPFIPHLLLVI